MTTHTSTTNTLNPYLARELRDECKAWKQQLDKMMLENTNQKNLLAEVLQTNSIKASDHLDEAEQFQNEFLWLDAALKLMRYDINLHYANLDKPYQEDAGKQELLTRQNTLRHEMVAIDSEYQAIRYNFYTYLATFC